MELRAALEHSVSDGEQYLTEAQEIDVFAASSCFVHLYTSRFEEKKRKGKKRKEKKRKEKKRKEKKTVAVVANATSFKQGSLQ